MFASMFKTLLNKSEVQAKKELFAVESETVKISSKDVKNMLTELDEIKDNSDNCSVTKDYVTDAFELLSIVDNRPKHLNDNASIDNFDDTKSEVSSIGENQIDIATIEDPNIKKIVNKINSLQCLFTWNVKSKKKKNFILHIRNKYGKYNLNISSSDFTLERFIGNLIISYELFHNGERELAQMKILEIGKWLEELDKSTDEFYLSIKIGLQHIMKATFIHMLFASNLTGECKWLLDDIVLMSIMDSKSRASLYAIHAAVLIEYGGDLNYLKKACELTKKACSLDPKTSHWFYIHSLALTAQRQFLLSYKSVPTENEIDAINQANILFNGINILFKYHEIILFKDTTVGNYHNDKNKNDKSLMKKNVQDNKKIVNMIKTLISNNPKDPLLVVNCARILMTLPIMVRDFNLGKQYLTKAFEMASNDSTVLYAIENTVQAYKDITKKQKPKNNETKQNQSSLKIDKSKLEIDLGLTVKIQKNGEDPIPYLTYLISLYDGLDKSKIIAQLCSYIILFTNNLRSSVEEFIKLIEIPGMTNNDIITKHSSLFGSKPFNLSELICNEIRLATNLSSTSSDDMLYYYKMLAKIMESCNLKIKEVDSSMKSKLIVDSYDKTKCLNTSENSETESSDEIIDKNIKKKKKNKVKHLQTKGPKIFTHNDKLNKESKITNDNTSEKVQNKKPQPQNNKPQPQNEKPQPQNKKPKPQNEKPQPQNKNPQPKAYDDNQMKVKMEKVLNSFNRKGDGLNSESKNLERSLEVNSEIHRYTQHLYQNILASTHLRFNSPSVSSGDLNSYFNQNHANFSSPIQNLPHTPPLLSLRPQINPQNPKSKPKTNSVQLNSKKK